MGRLKVILKKGLKLTPFDDGPSRGTGGPGRPGVNSRVGGCYDHEVLGGNSSVAVCLKFPSRLLTLASSWSRTRVRKLVTWEDRDNWVEGGAIVSDDDSAT